MIIGEISACLAALSYSVASHLIYESASKFPPMLISVLRNGIAMLISFATAILFSQYVFPPADLKLYAYLIASGVAGVGVCDTLYLMSISMIGARKAILLETLAPPFTGLITYFMYGSTLSFLGWFGVGLTIYGIIVVVNAENKQTHESSKLNESLTIKTQNDFKQKEIENQEIQIADTSINSQVILNIESISKPISSNLVIGVICGSSSMFFQALGMVLSHEAMISGYFNSMTSTYIRLLAGILSTSVIMIIKKQSFYWPQQTNEGNKRFLQSVLIGSLFGIWAQQFSLIYTIPEISQTILATTPLFGLIISKYKGEIMKPEYYVGSLLAVFGVAIIIWS